MTADEIVWRLKGKWTGDQASARCPVEGHGKGRGDLSPSLSIAVGSGGRVLLHCFAGCRAEDIFAALLSVPPPVGAEPQATRASTLPRRETLAAVQRVWQASRPVNGTAGETYLRSRGLEPDCDALHFLPTALHPDAKGRDLSTLLAAIHGPDGVLLALQRTFLTRAGAKADVSPVRMMLGRLGNGAVRLARANSVLGLAEGVETALAASQLHGVPCWAACGARLERITLPPAVRHVVLFADNDAPGLRTACRGAERFRHEGRSVEVLVPNFEGSDWNDALLAIRA